MLLRGMPHAHMMAKGRMPPRGLLGGAGASVSASAGAAVAS